MRLRNRIVRDVEDDRPSVASGSSSDMTEANSSQGAALGSPVTRRSWSTTHDSQESFQNLPSVPPRAPRPYTHDQQHSSSEPPSARQQTSYLTDYEVATQVDPQEYPTSITDSQGDLYTETHTPSHHEEEPAYVQPSSLLVITHSLLHPNNNPQTPVQPRASSQNPLQTPYSNTPIQRSIPHMSNGVSSSYPYQTPMAQVPARCLDYGEHARCREANEGNSPPHGQSLLSGNTNILTAFPPFQLNLANPTHLAYGNGSPSEQIYLQTPASESLTRYVTSDNEESWSPAAQTNPETHRRRISEADETVDGFRHNKMRTELDGMERRGEGGESQGRRSRRRRRASSSEESEGLGLRLGKKRRRGRGRGSRKGKVGENSRSTSESGHGSKEDGKGREESSGSEGRRGK